MNYKVVIRRYRETGRRILNRPVETMEPIGNTSSKMPIFIEHQVIVQSEKQAQTLINCFSCSGAKKVEAFE